jgi:hypothetical protein
MATLCPGASSSDVKVLPSIGFASSIGNNEAETRAAVTRSGSPWPEMSTCSSRKAPRVLNDLCSRTKMAKSGAEKPTLGYPIPGKPSPSAMSLDGSLNGKGRKSTVFTTLKIAVFAPMPSASVTTATAVKPGFLASIRKP